MRAERPRVLADELRESSLMDIRLAALYPFRSHQLRDPKQGS